MNSIHEELLIRYLQGGSTPEESAIVEAWELQSDENRKILEHFYFLLQSAGCLKVMHEADPQTALHHLKKKIRTHLLKARIRRTMTMVQRAAAVLFIPILLIAGHLVIEELQEARRYVEVKTNPGMVSSFDLPDGSKVWLNSGGSLKYPAEFSSRMREVQLKGQGYFEVKRDEDTPFYVRIDDFYSVEVLGTEFNVSAYEDDHLIETTLVTGKVKLNIRLADGRLIQKILSPNQKAVYDRDTHRLHITTVNTESDTVWKEGRIIFRQHPMEQVIKVLSRHYNVRFEVKDPKVWQSELTAKFTNEPLPQVLEYIKLASDVKFKFKQHSRIENDTLRVSVIELYK